MPLTVDQTSETESPVPGCRRRRGKDLATRSWPACRRRAGGPASAARHEGAEHHGTVRSNRYTSPLARLPAPRPFALLGVHQHLAEYPGPPEPGLCREPRPWSGSSAMWTPMPVFSAISRSSPGSSAPPPARVIPRVIMSATSSGGVSSMVSVTASTIVLIDPIWPREPQRWGVPLPPGGQCECRGHGP